jgi:hypothetical protein
VLRVFRASRFLCVEVLAFCALARHKAGLASVPGAGGLGRFHCPPESKIAAARARMHGQVAEWLKAHAWNACIGATLSRVRIPPCPPVIPVRYCFYLSKQFVTETEAQSIHMPCRQTAATLVARVRAVGILSHRTVKDGEGADSRQTVSRTGLGDRQGTDSDGVRG